MALLRARPGVPAEDQFLDRYSSLVRYALDLTRQDRPEAEDLVHDAFVRFTVVRPALRDLDKLNAYLHAMLRNLHMSRTRRRTRRGEIALPLLEYDSLEIARDAVDPQRWLEARDEFRAACRYGCLRKGSSKAGSVFLLRFFLGFLPGEIGRLLRCSTARVDEFLFWARRELRTYLTEPQRLSFMGDRGSVEYPNGQGHASAVDDPGAFFSELRAVIFAAPHATCFPADALEKMYSRSDVRQPLETRTAAELVGCRDCLEQACAVLAMPQASDRDPTDTIGPGSRTGEPPAPPARKDAIASGLRRVRDVLFHRPRELRVVVNGFELAREKLAGAASELTLKVNTPEPVRLIELLSEQDLCLAFLDVFPPPDGEMEQEVHVELSEGRRLDLRVSFEDSCPVVRARYRDTTPTREATAGAAPDEPPTESPAEEGSGAPSRQKWWRLPDWAPSLRRPLAWALSLAVAVWLLFFTPGTQVSAAERLMRAALRLADRILQPNPVVRPGSSRSQQPQIPIVVPPVPPAPPGPPVRARLDERAAVELELAALVRLRGAEAYIGQEVSVGRASGNWVRLQATVATGKRRGELVRALGPLAGVQGLDLKFRTLSKLTSSGARGAASGPVRAYQLPADRFPAFEAVHDFLLTRDSLPASVDEQVRTFASEVFLGSRAASQHAWSLRHIAKRYPWLRVETLAPSARRDWRELLGVHAQAFLTAQRGIEARLRPVFGPADDATVAPALTAEDIWSLSERLLVLDTRREAAIGAAFTASDDAGGVDGVRADQFWQELREAAARAEAIARLASDRP